MSEADETHGLGYARVDDDPHRAVLLATMDATARWDATRRLRAWERERLGLRPGQKVLDVGCGLGDAVLALGADVGPDGEVVGIDASAEMVAAARARAGSAPCPARFAVGDALALAAGDATLDVVRSERTLQWLADPSAAVAEMARVVVPGGRVALIDTDWSTFRIDVGDADLGRRVVEAVRTERGRPSNVGGRLADLAVAAGLAPSARTQATQHWSDWDPDTSPAPTGCFSMTSLADTVVDAGALAPEDRDRFVATTVEAARAGRFAMDLTMVAVVATAPAPATGL